LSTRPQVKPNPVITNGNMASNIIGTPTIISNVSMVSYGFSWSGSTPVGTVSVQASNDYELGADGKTVLNAGTWNTLTLNYGGSAVTTIPLSGNTGNGLIDIDALAAYAVRPIYTASSGTGTMQCTVVGKVT
jgi:hypothetical protein